MNWAGYLSMSFYSTFLLVFVYVQAAKQIEKKDLSYHLYMILLRTTFVLLICDILSRLDHSTGIFFLIVSITNFALFLLGIFATSIWLAYVHYQVFQDKKKTVKLFYPLTALNGLMILLLTLSQFNGWVYYFDSEHVYHRGPLFILPAVCMIGLIVISTILIIANHKNVEPKYMFSLLFFPVPPLVGGIIQIFCITMPLAVSCNTLSMLIIFVNVQNQNLGIDSLTNVYNRRKLNTYLADKISSVSPNQTFSAILIDLDHFKSINDSWGHIIGDHALKSAASVLRSSLGAGTFVARYGGDEFCVILDITDADSLQKCVNQIRKDLAEFNRSSHVQYSLSFSMGYKVYDCKNHFSATEFLCEIDELMYQNKKEIINDIGVTK